MHERASGVAALTCLLATGCGAATTGGTGGNGSSASCVGPYLDAVPAGAALRSPPPPPTVAPGSSVTIHGHWYTSTCNDTGGHDPLVPLPAVHLTATLPGGRTLPLGVATPTGQDLGFAVELRVPTGTPPGTVTVRDDRDPAATYRFAVGRAED